jgi:hypothetical protein
MGSASPSRSAFLKNNTKSWPAWQEIVDFSYHALDRALSPPLENADRPHQPNPVSIAVGLYEAAGLETGLGERALALDETFFGLRAAKDSTILSGFRLLTLALLQLSRAT